MIVSCRALFLFVRLFWLFYLFIFFCLSLTENIIGKANRKWWLSATHSVGLLILEKKKPLPSFNVNPNQYLLLIRTIRSSCSRFLIWRTKRSWTGLWTSYVEAALWSSGLGRWIWNREVPGSNPPLCRYLDLFLRGSPEFNSPTALCK